MSREAQSHRPDNGPMSMAEEMSYVQAEFGGKPSEPMKKKTITMAPEGMAESAAPAAESATVRKTVPVAESQPAKVEPAKIEPAKEATPEPELSPAEERARALMILDDTERKLQRDYAAALAKLTAEASTKTFRKTNNDYEFNNIVMALDKLRALRRKITSEGVTPNGRLSSMTRVQAAREVPASEPRQATEEPAAQESAAKATEERPKRPLPTAKRKPSWFFKAGEEITPPSRPSGTSFDDGLDQHVASLLHEAEVRSVTDLPRKEVIEPTDKIEDIEESDFVTTGDSEERELPGLPAPLEEDVEAWFNRPETSWKPLGELEKDGTRTAWAELTRRLTPESLMKEYQYVLDGTVLDLLVLGFLPEDERLSYQEEADKRTARLLDLLDRLNKLGVEVGKKQ